MTKQNLNLKSLVDEGAQKVRSSGQGATKVAFSLYDCGRVELLSKDDIRHMAVRGLAPLIQESLNRGLSPPEFDADTRREVDRLHAESGCRRGSHRHDFHARYRCVEPILHAQDNGQRSAEMDRRKKANGRVKDREERHAERQTKLVNEVRVEVLSRVIYQGADRVMKSLFKFTLEDVRFQKDRFGKEIKGFSDRLQWYAVAEKAMLKEGKNSVEELPAAELRGLEEMAGRVWKDSKGSTEQESFASANGRA